MTAAGAGNLRRRRIDHLDQRLLPGLRVHHLTEQLGRQIEIDAARTPGDGGADRARDADADVGGMQHAERRLAERLGDGELVHLLVVALLQVDDLALGRAARSGSSGKQLVVALASAVRPLRKPGADTVRQTPGFLVRKPAIEAALPAFCSCRNEMTRMPAACAMRPKSVIGMPGTP